MDQPPLSVALLAAIRSVAGDSLVALRLAAAILGAAGAFVAGAVARELGGRAAAQTAAALAVGLAPIGLGIAHFYSMNVIDYGLWALATLLALRAFDRPASSRWLALGVVLGLGLLNKWSVMWLSAGLAVGLLVSPARRALRTPGPWLAAAAALLIFAPHVLWQVAHDWPTLEFMRNARGEKMLALDAGRFLLEQILSLGPGGAPIWLAGLGAAIARPRWRPLAAIHLVTLAILLGSGAARVEYATLAVPALFAAGATWWESLGRRWVIGAAALAVALALPLAPFAIPVLPVDRFVAWQSALGREPHTEERHEMGALPQHYADMFGWPELADSVARVAATLTPEERAGAIVVVDNYGEAGALERFGAGRLPRIACQHNNWFLWGPPDWDGRVGIFVGRDRSELAGEFESVEMAGVAGHPLAMPYERDLPIAIARGFRADLKAAWQAGRHYR